MKDRLKYIPAIVSLVAGLVASTITIINRYDTLNIMIITLISLLIFYIAGLILKIICEKNFVIEEPDEESTEGDTDETADGEEKEKTETSEGEQTDEINSNE